MLSHPDFRLQCLGVTATEFSKTLLLMGEEVDIALFFGLATVSGNLVTEGQVPVRAL